MTGTFLKSTTAIVLSLSLAVPHAAIAQVTLDDVELEVNTEGMTEAEIEALKLKKLEEMQAAEAQSLPEQAEGEAKTECGAGSDEARRQGTRLGAFHQCVYVALDIRVQCIRGRGRQGDACHHENREANIRPASRRHAEHR